MDQVRLISFPCTKKKIPIVTGWQNLDRSIYHVPGTYYGLLCGRKAGFIVIDCDLLKKDDPNKFIDGVKAWTHLTRINQWTPNTLVVKTQSGGLHVYFRYEPHLTAAGVQKISGSVIGDSPSKKIKIDVLSDGKQVIGPLSPNYKILGGSFDEIAEIPQWLKAILQSPGQARKRHSPDPQPQSKQKKSNASITREKLYETVNKINVIHADNRDSWCKIVLAIATVARENNFDGTQIAIEFSKQSSKYKDEKEVLQIYEKSNGSLNYGTILWYAENDACNDENVCDRSVTNGDNVKLREDLEKLVPSMEKIVKIEHQRVTQKVHFVTRTGEEESIVIFNCNIRAVIGNNDLGYVISEMTLKKCIDFLGPDFSGNSRLEFNNNEKLIINNSGQNVYIYYPWDSKMTSVTIENRLNRRKEVTQKNVRKLMFVVEDAISHVFSDRWNIILGKQINYSNTRSAAEDEKHIRSPDEFIDAILESSHDLRLFMKFCGLHNFTSFSGFYICNRVTNLWKKEHDVIVHQEIKKRALGITNLTEAEIDFLRFPKNLVHLRESLAHQIPDFEFDEKLDSNLDLFVMQNKAFNVQTGEFRDICMDDHASITCGWSYSHELAEQYRDDVSDFMTKLFPVVEEREIILTYIASCMHGHRLDKRFLILTDKRQGNNGKSTLLSLLRAFFGDYLKSNKKFVCKPKYEIRDRNSHEGGMAAMKGKRILLCDELSSSQVFDDDFIKLVCGGRNEEVTGRRCGSQDEFKFTWQAALLLCCNEGDCPAFQTKNSAFLNRMVIGPMRSKFVKNPDAFEDEPYTYLMNEYLNKKGMFENWCSSLFDYLRPYCNSNCLAETTIPNEMLEWRNEIIDANDELSTWIMDRLEPTDNEADFATLNDVYILYKRIFCNGKPIGRNDFYLAVKTYLNLKQITIVENLDRGCNLNRVRKRNCIRGFKFIVS